MFLIVKKESSEGKLVGRMLGKKRKKLKGKGIEDTDVAKTKK